MSDKIKSHHLQRKAILYIRQSSPHQVMHNQESRKLQHAMKQQLEQLGWQEIEIIDDDLGYTATGTVTRQGFERMVAEVCLGNVGVVAARELSRFARNNREWQQLIEMCRVVDTLLIDKDAVYTPRSSNDRLLLGLKGSLNEYELDLLRARSVEARYAKARRGELVVAAPVGFLKTPDQRLEKDPNRRVQEAILLVFRKFRELGSVRQTLLWFLEEGLELPVRRSDGTTVWKRPGYAIVYRLLTNPAYGGAYAYGKTEATISYVNGQARGGQRRKRPEQWLALIPEAHEGYISWVEFQSIQQRLADNLQGWERSGAIKHGAALLTGLLRCRRCGRKLMVHYMGSRPHGFLRYCCRRGQLDQGEPRCISFGGIPVDAAIAREILRVVQPGAVEASVLASQEIANQQDDVRDALRRDLEAARYEAQRAQKQFDAVDPENRLVADELERRWNQALQRVHQLEQRLEEQSADVGNGVPATMDEFQNLAADLEAIWNGDHTDARLKKRIVRTLIQEVVADIDAAAGEVILVIHWRGGVHTELRVPRRRRGSCSPTSKDIVCAVRSLARICDDTAIAGVLNRNGLRTGCGNRWTRMRVTSLRCKNSIPVYSSAERAAQNWLTLTEAARFLGVSSRTLRLAVEQRRIEGEHPLPDGPWIFSRQALQTEAAAQVVTQARFHRAPPAVPNSEEENPGLFDK